MVKLPLAWLWSRVAVTCSRSFAEPGELAVLVTRNVPAVFPPAIVIEAGTEPRLDELAAKATTAPSGDAAPLKVTVPVDGRPASTVAGANVTEMTVIGMVSQNHISKLPPRRPSPLWGIRRPV